MDKMRVIGIMSGGSLDGLEVCIVDFSYKMEYRLIASKTFPFREELAIKLKAIKQVDLSEYFRLNLEFAQFEKESILSLCLDSDIELSTIDLISTHGHTVAHQPKLGYSITLGDNNYLSAQLGIQVVGDFRGYDVALGGQGAPLVPLVDFQLFKGHSFYLNLGGIANISFLDPSGQIKGFDLVPFNNLLNHYIKILNPELPYDAEGEIAKSGNLNAELYKALFEWNHLQGSNRLSLEKEDSLNQLLKIIQPFQLKTSIADILHTYCHFVTDVLTKVIKDNFNREGSSIFITGGGVYHTYFIDLLSQQLKGIVSVQIPPKEIIEFKEAIAFAFLGYKRYLHQVNILKSVTGADRDSCAGAIYGINIHKKTHSN